MGRLVLPGRTTVPAVTVWQGRTGAMAVPVGWAATVVGEGGFSVTAAPVALAVSAGRWCRCGRRCRRCRGYRNKWAGRYLGGRR